MTVSYTCDVHCDRCGEWVRGVTAQGPRGLARAALRVAKAKGWSRNVRSTYTDLCPKCLHENGDARRTGTTGRFKTREELEAWVWHNWTNTTANQSDIARQCRVSPTTVANILKKGKP